MKSWLVHSCGDSTIIQAEWWMFTSNGLKFGIGVDYTIAWFQVWDYFIERVKAGETTMTGENTGKA